MNNIKIPVYIPYLKGKYKEYVNDCLDTTWISSKGKYIHKFEDLFSRFIDIKHSYSVSNGTVALHVALEALGISEGDEVLVPTLTYIASVNSIIYTRAKPVFIDSCSDTWCLDPKEIESKINAKTKAIMVVHLYGNSCEMDEIIALARKYNLYVIEDCAEATGTYYKGKHVGSFGDVSTFSFFGNKTITTGEGGMVCTNNSELGDKIDRIKGQGLARNREYWHDILGYNYRMTNIQAAIGCSQLELIDEILQKKNEIVKHYVENLRGLPVVFQEIKNYVQSSHWMFCILLEDQSLREKLRDFLGSRGIETRPVFYPIHTMPIYSHLGGNLPRATYLGAAGINLPSYPELSKDSTDMICNEIRNFFQ